MSEFPPLRACWGKRGEQRVVVISGRNGRRVIHGALNAACGDFVALIRERSRQDDCLAIVDALGRVHPGVPKLLVWDNAPGITPRRTIPSAWRPQPRPPTSRSPGCPSARPNSCRARICGASRRRVAANRPYRDEQAAADLVQSFAEQALHSIGGLFPPTASAVLPCSAHRLRGSLLRTEPPHWVSLGGAVRPGRDTDSVAGAVGEDPNGRSVGVIDDATAGR